MAAARTPPVRERELSLAEHTCLALVVQGVAHGWAIGSMLAPGGELGRIWTLSRPLTYRAVDALVDRRLVTRKGSVAGQGRERTLLAASAAGRRITERWVAEPVDHLRDVRTELLLKLELRRRAGLPLEPLLLAQRDVVIERIDARSDAQDGGDLVDLWRAEHVRAIRRFLDHALHPAPRPAHTNLRLSARNQLHGTVTSVTHGDVMSSVRLELPDGQRLTAAITREATEDLDLAPGDDVVAVVKSTEVMLATPG